MNSLFVIAPSEHLDMGVFDDEARGSVAKPLTSRNGPF